MEEERELIFTDEDSADVGATFDGDLFDKIAMRSARRGLAALHEGDSVLVPMRLQRFLARAGIEVGVGRKGS